MKKLLFMFVAFSLLSLSIVSTSFSQTSGEKNVGKVGAFRIATPLPLGWRIGADVERKANEILESESVEQKVSFATMFGARGPIIYGTWNQFAPGFTASASSIARGVSESIFPTDWALVPGELKVQTKMLSSQFEYAYFRIVARGNGRQFGTAAGTTRTVGIWIDIPVAYKEGGKLAGGIVSLYLRGAETDFKGASKHGAEQLLVAIADSLTPVDSEFAPLEALIATARPKDARPQRDTPASPGARSEPVNAMALSDATRVINASTSTPSQVLAACEAVRQNISWAPRPDFKSANPELRRLDSICESRYEKTILFARIEADFSENEKLETYLTPLYESAKAAGPVSWCNFLVYVDSIWEKNNYSRPSQCPKKSP